MAVTERPNKRILDQTIDIYRDCMRKFLIDNLGNVPDRTLESAVELRLPDHRRDQLQMHLRQGKGIEGFIDTGDFPHLILQHWDSVFGEVFKGNRNTLTHCRSVALARNVEAHIDTSDIGTAETRAYLYHIAEVLGHINYPDEKRKVEELQKKVADPDVAKLEASLGELMLRLNSMDERLEQLDRGAERDRAEIESHVEDTGEVIREMVEMIREMVEMIPRIEEVVSQVQSSNSQSASDSPGGDELERLSSEVERNKRLITDSQSENSELRNRIDNIEGLFAQTQAASVEGADYGLDDESEEEDKALWWGDDIKDNTLLGRPPQSSFPTVRTDRPPGVWSGALFYCAVPSCVFFDGSRRAWWNKWKAVDHMRSTGHRIARV